MAWPTFPNLGNVYQSSGLGAAYKWFTRDLPNYMSNLFYADNSLKPAHLSDADAPNDSMYFSTTANGMVYKDSAGAVHNL